MRSQSYAMCFVAAAVAVVVCPAFAQSTALTYQGQLKDAGDPADGLHDFRFRLFDAAAGGSQVGATLCADNVDVVDGLFTVILDFDQQFATQEERHLDIAVRRDTGLNCSNPAGFVILAPRQELTAAPFASHAKSAFALDAADGSPASAVFVDDAGNVGIGTTTPAKPLTVNGDVEIGVNSGDYHHLRLGGGNSDGFLYGSFPRFGDGIHIGYNYFADAAGVNRIIHTDGGTSRMSMQYGAISLATAPAFGGEPINRVVVDTIGNVGVGTVTPLSRLDVRGDIRLGPSGQFRAASGEENLRIIRGVVAANGSIIAGSGFTVRHNSVGNYVITFNTPFAGLPSVTGTAENDGRELAEVVMTDGVTAANATLVIVLRSDNWFDLPFHFIAVGPR